MVLEVVEHETAGDAVLGIVFSEVPDLVLRGFAGEEKGEEGEKKEQVFVHGTGFEVQFKQIGGAGLGLGGKVGKNRYSRAPLV